MSLIEKKPAVIIANAPDQLIIPDEELAAILQLLENQPVTNIGLYSVSKKRLQTALAQNLNNILLFHFSGHGDKETLRFEGDYYHAISENNNNEARDDYYNEIEEGKKISSSNLANILAQDKTPISIVFLNACQSFVHVSDLLAKDIKIVLATNKNVDDNIARDVSVVFYEYFFYHNYSIANAFRKAKAVLGKTELDILVVDSTKVNKETTIPAEWTLFINAKYDRLPLAGWTLADFIRDFEGKSTAQSPYSRELSQNLIRTKADNFVGREDVLVEISQKLKSEKNQVINGVGGLGKSTLMQRYLDEYYHEYTHILWVDMGENQESGSFKARLIWSDGLLDSLKINYLEKSNERIYSELLNKLKTLPAPNLLLIDNAEEIAFEGVNTPFKDWDNWQVLVTSREKIGIFRERANFPLRDLNPEEAKFLFKKYYKLAKLSDTEIDELLKGLDYHTLLVEIFAKTANNRNSGMNELRDIVKNNKAVRNVKVQEDNQKFKEVKKVGDFLQKLFAISNLDDYEKLLLIQLSCLPSQWHKYSLLLELISPEDEGDFADALNSLAHKGWIGQDDVEDSYKLHTVVQLSTRPSLNPNFEQVRTLCGNIIENLDIEWEGHRYQQKSTWLPFGEAFVAYFDKLENAEIGGILNFMGLIATDLADYQKAEIYLNKAINIYEKIDKPQDAVKCYSNLAALLEYTGDDETALSIYEKYRDKNCPPAFYNNWALLLLNQNRLEEAKSLLDKVRSIAPKEPATYNSFGMYNAKIGNQKEAENMYRHALFLKPTLLEQAAIYSNWAMLIEDNNEKTAKQLYEYALCIYIAKLKEEHPSIATGCRNLAVLLHKMGENEKAKELYERALYIYSVAHMKSLGTWHLNIAECYSNFSQLLQGMGKYEEAKEQCEKALEIHQKVHTEENLGTAMCYNNLSTVLEKLGDYEEAKRCCEKALEIYEKIWKEDKEHPPVAATYNNLAVLLYKMGNEKQALQYIETAYDIFLKKLGDQHPHTQNAKKCLDIIKNNQ